MLIGSAIQLSDEIETVIIHPNIAATFSISGW